jgi:hypothetical protein
MGAPTPVYGCALAMMLFCLELFAVLDAEIPFIYFQFLTTSVVDTYGRAIPRPWRYLPGD